MKFFSLALLATAASASPTIRYFNLISTGASNNTYNDLYLSTQTSGPLNSKAVFTSKGSDAGIFTMANGTVRYKAENSAPWELALVNEEKLKSGVEVSVSPEYGSTGFVLGKDHILKDSSTSFGGWIFCRDKGLYYVNADVGSDIPERCYSVDLRAKFELST